VFAYPIDGTVVALDLDIPPSLQRLPLKLSAAAEKDWRWRLDHQALGRAIGRASWLPQRAAID
jgi:penicillin-binding protein 1C